MTFMTRLLGRDAGPSSERREPTITASAAAAAGAGPENWILGAVGSAQSRVPSLPRVSPEIAQRHATVFACGNIIAGDHAKVPLRVVQKDERTGRMVPVKEHALDYLLNVESTPGVPAILTRFNMAYSFAIRGNSFAYAPRDGAGDPLFIEYVHNDRCSVLRDGRERFYDFEDGAQVMRRAPSRSMVHLRYIAEDGWTGRSPLLVAAESVGIALAGQEAAARNASGSQVRGFVKLEDNFGDEETRNRGINRVRAMMSDPQAEGWPVLGQNDEIKTLDLSAADQELLSSRKFDREQIAAIYRMPPSKLQMLEHGVKANGEQQAIDYRTDCLLHWSKPIEDFMELGLLTRGERQGKGLQLLHDFDALMEATTKERFEAAAHSVGGPWETVNERRAKEGLRAIEGGELLYPPANMTREMEPQGGSKESDNAE